MTRDSNTTILDNKSSLEQQTNYTLTEQNLAPHLCYTNA